jgi:multiple sugar transport system ATP-binding protein
MAQIEIKNISKAHIQPKRMNGSALAAVALDAVEQFARGSGKKREPVHGKDLLGSFFKPMSKPIALKDINLTIPDGKTMVILGPSGCGKTTLLRILGGLDRPDTGTVSFNGRNAADLKPVERNIGMVFQNYALYPVMKAKKNIISYYIFRKKNTGMKEELAEKFKKTSELLGVDIEYLLDKSPLKLSGGEKQRVALGRCITRNPELFLMDEPFANLDAVLRRKYRVHLKKLLNQLKITAVYVTHDQEEAQVLGDIIAVMDKGSIIQTGTYDEMYRNPSCPFVAEFINPHTEAPAINWLDGDQLAGPGFAGKKVGVRPRDFEVSAEARDGALKGRISISKEIVTDNSRLLFINLTDNNEIVAIVPDGREFEEGRDVWLNFSKFHLFEKEN